jgi:SAM-dependent methyltransferase
MAKKLNLGAGERPMEGYVNLDWEKRDGTDVVHDLNTVPYPFSDSHFDEVYVSHVLEHLDRPFDVMKELHRILKPGAKLHIKVPHFSRGFSHAEHTHGFDVTFPLYFNPDKHMSGYYGYEYRIDHGVLWPLKPHELEVNVVLLSLFVGSTVLYVGYHILQLGWTQ